MQNLMLKIAITVIGLCHCVQWRRKLGTGWTMYKPGLVTSAISNGETVLLGYLSSW